MPERMSPVAPVPESQQPQDSQRDEKGLFARIAKYLKGQKQETKAHDGNDTISQEETDRSAATALSLTKGEADAIMREWGGGRSKEYTQSSLDEEYINDPAAYLDRAARLAKTIASAGKAEATPLQEDRESHGWGGAARETKKEGKGESNERAFERARSVVDSLGQSARARVETVAPPETRKNFGEFWKNVGTFFKLEGKDQLRKTILSAVGVTAAFLIPGVGAFMGPVALAAALGSRGGELATRMTLFCNPKGKEASVRMALEISQTKLETTNREIVQIHRDIARVPEGPDRKEKIEMLHKALHAKAQEAERTIEQIRKQSEDAATIRAINQKIASRVGFVAGLLAGGVGASNVLHSGVMLNLDNVPKDHLVQWGKDGIQWFAGQGGGETAALGWHSFGWKGVADIGLRGAGAAALGMLPNILRFGNRTLARAGTTKENYHGMSSGGSAEMTSSDQREELAGLPDYAQKAAQWKETAQQASKDAAQSQDQGLEELKQKQREETAEKWKRKKEETEKRLEKAGGPLPDLRDERFDGMSPAQIRDWLLEELGIHSKHSMQDTKQEDFATHLGQWVRSSDITINELDRLDHFLKRNEMDLVVKAATESIMSSAQLESLQQRISERLRREPASSEVNVVEGAQQLEDESSQDSQLPSAEEVSTKPTTELRLAIAQYMGVGELRRGDVQVSTKFMDHLMQSTPTLDAKKLEAVRAFVHDNQKALLEDRSYAQPTFANKEDLDRFVAALDARAQGLNAPQESRETEKKIRLLTWSEIKDAKPDELRSLVLQRIHETKDTEPVGDAAYAVRMAQWISKQSAERLEAFGDFLKGARELSERILAQKTDTSIAEKEKHALFDAARYESSIAEQKERLSSES